MEKLGVAQAPLALVGSLRGNFTWTLLGNLAYAGCQWGILVAFAKFGDARMVGEFGLGLAITGPMFMFANLNLGSVLATDPAGASAFRDYLGARLLTTAAAFLSSCVAALATRSAPGVPAVIISVGAMKAVESLSDIFHGLFQRQETMDRIAKSMTLRGACSLGAVVLAVHISGSVAAAATAAACVSTLVLFGFDSPKAAALLGGVDRLFPRFGARQLLTMIRVSLPLGIVTLLISLTTNIPRYFLEHVGGSRALGIFVGMAYIVTASTTVVGAIGRAALPRMANLHAAGQALAFRRLVRKLVLYGFAFGAGGLLIALAAGRPLLRFLYTAEYADYAPAFAVVMLSGAVGHAASLLGYAVTAGRRFVAQVPLWIAVALATAVSSALLIPRFGVTGGAWALVASAAMQFASYALLYATRVVRPLRGAGS